VKFCSIAETVPSFPVIFVAVDVNRLRLHGKAKAIFRFRTACVQPP